MSENVYGFFLFIQFTIILLIFCDTKTATDLQQWILGIGHDYIVLNTVYLFQFMHCIYFSFCFMTSLLCFFISNSVFASFFFAQFGFISAFLTFLICSLGFTFASPFRYIFYSYFFTFGSVFAFSDNTSIKIGTAATFTADEKAKLLSYGKCITTAKISIVVLPLIYFSQKQLARKLKSRHVIIECTGYIFWRLFLRRI